MISSRPLPPERIRSDLPDFVPEDTKNLRDYPVELPKLPVKPDEPLIPHIAAYLRRLLENFEGSEFIRYLVVPSPKTLAEFFGCTESDIESALRELGCQGYQYELSSTMNGREGPITLWDPLIRQDRKGIPASA